MDKINQMPAAWFPTFAYRQQFKCDQQTADAPPGAADY